MSTNINLTGNSRIKLIQEINSRRKKSQSREWRPLPYHIKLTKVRLFKTHYFSWPSFSLFCPGQGTIKVTGTFCAKKAILIFFFKWNSLCCWEMIKLPQHPSDKAQSTSWKKCLVAFPERHALSPNQSLPPSFLENWPATVVTLPSGRHLITL